VRGFGIKPKEQRLYQPVEEPDHDPTGTFATRAGQFNQ
jgi:hypothetical protein